MKLINTLRTVAEGKIYMEVERARLTKVLTTLKELDGDISGAATIMEELQVETYRSMEKREKVNFCYELNILMINLYYICPQVELILKQMRLCLVKHDFVRTQIIAKKINTKFFMIQTIRI